MSVRNMLRWLREMYLPFAFVFLAFIAIGTVGYARLEIDEYGILLRFTENLRAGHGLIYRLTGSEVTTYPLLPVMAAPFAGSEAWMRFIHFLIDMLAFGIGGYCLGRLMGSVWIGLIYVPLAVLALIPPSAAALGLSLFGLERLKAGRHLLAGIGIGLAVTAGPEAIPAVMIGLALAAYAGWPALRRFLLPLLFVLAVAIYAVPDLPLTAFLPGSIGWAIPALGLVALVWMRLSGRSVSPAVGALIGVALVVDLTGGGAPSLPVAASYEPGKRIAQALQPDSVLATEDIGLLAYYAGTRILDLSERIGPHPLDDFLFGSPACRGEDVETARYCERAFLARYAPDAFALRTGQTRIPLPLLENRYALVYTQNDLSFYVRAFEWAGLDDHPVDSNLSASLDRDDLRLVNVAVGNTLHPGDVARVRLDWQVRHAPTFRGHIEIKLDLMDESFAGYAPGVLDKLPAVLWRAGAFSTYHLMPIPPDARTGSASLYLNVSVRGGNVGTFRVATTTLSPR